MEFYFPIWFPVPLDAPVFILQSTSQQNNSQTLQTNPVSNTSFNNQRWDKYLEIFRSYLEKKPNKPSKKIWTKSEDELLFNLYDQGMDWEKISRLIPQSNYKICQRRYQRLKDSLEKWPRELDQLIKYLAESEQFMWPKIHNLIYSNTFQAFPKHTMKQLKERYLLNLRPGITTQQWTVQQDIALLRTIRDHGTQWRRLSEIIPGRTQLQLKNRFYGSLKPLKKKVLRKLNKTIKQKATQINQTD